MSSWSTRVWDDWLKNGTPYHDSDTFVEPQNFKDAVQFQTVVLAVEIDELTTKKISECGAKETQPFNFRNYSVVFNISNKHL